MNRESLKLSLALAWLRRARGKSSHSGFGRCLSEAAKYLPEELIAPLERANLHYQRPIKELITKLLNMGARNVGGDMPTILELEGELEELPESYY